MSIKSFLDAANILYEKAKYNEALCLACIAVDACSAKLYSDKTVSERYKHFLKDHFTTICHYGFPGIAASCIRIKINKPIDNLKVDCNGYVDITQIIYHVLRCSLVHQCDLDKTIIFTETTIIGDWNPNEFYIPKQIIKGLIESVKENFMNDL